MNVLIIYAHPSSKSLNYSILEKVKKGLSRGKHDVKVINLYDEKFDPTLVVNEQKRRRDLFQDPYTEKYRTLISNADHLILIYPIWWHGPPAILKGFIDRVFVSEFAYSYAGKKRGAILPHGLLKDKSAWCIYTLDAPFLISLLDPSWLTMKHYILGYCGIKKVKRYMLSSVKRRKTEYINSWLDYIQRKASQLK